MTSQSMVRVADRYLDVPAMSVPDSGFLNVNAYSLNEIAVSTTALLIEGMLYSFSGVLSRFEEQDWYFKADTIQAPKLRGKRREYALQIVTTAARQYIKDRPEIMQTLKAKAWTQDLHRFDQQVRDAEYYIVDRQKEIERIEERYRESIARIDGCIERLQEHMNAMPDGAQYPQEYDWRLSNYLKNHLAKLTVESTSHDPT